MTWYIPDTRKEYKFAPTIRWRTENSLHKGFSVGVEVMRERKWLWMVWKCTRTNLFFLNVISQLPHSSWLAINNSEQVFGKLQGLTNHWKLNSLSSFLSSKIIKLTGWKVGGKKYLGSAFCNHKGNSWTYTCMHIYVKKQTNKKTNFLECKWNEHYIYGWEKLFLIV